jgi:GNAT superfamily N-acetyltransferase
VAIDLRPALRTAGVREVIVMERRIDLRRARRDAKALLRAARASDPEALARMRPDRAPRLADAQHAVARELGAPSWPALVRRVEVPELIHAARAGDAEEVYRLLEAGADPNARDPESGGTALHVAAYLGWADVIDVLVGWVPVDRQAVDDGESTALDACREGAKSVPREGGVAHRVIERILVANGVGGAPARELSADAGELAWQADVELFEYLATSPLAATRRVGDGFAFRTSLMDNTRNVVVCSRLEATEIPEVLSWLRGIPAQWLVAEETEPADLRARLERAGCQAERSSVYMAADMTQLTDRPAPPGLEIVPVPDAGELDDPLLASLGPGPLRHYAARLDGRPVGRASTFLASVALLGIDLHVASAERRRGIGRALVLHGLREGAVAGRTLALLAPTPATVPFYEDLGFTLGRFPPGRGFYTPL